MEVKMKSIVPSTISAAAKCCAAGSDIPHCHLCPSASIVCQAKSCKCKSIHKSVPGNAQIEKINVVENEIKNLLSTIEAIKKIVTDIPKIQETYSISLNYQSEQISKSIELLSRIKIINDNCNELIGTIIRR